MIVFAVLVGIGNILWMWDYGRWFVQPAAFAAYCMKKLLPLCVVAGALACGVYAFLPKLGHSDVQLTRSSPYRTWSNGKLFAAVLSEHPEILGRTEPEIAAFLIQGLQERAGEKSPPRNPVTGSELTLEDSPGNFTIEKQADQVILRVYHTDGSAMTKAFSMPAARTGARAKASNTGG